MLTRYSIESGDKCVLSGVISYGLFLNIQANVPFFKSNLFTVYDKLLGMNFYMILSGHKEQLKEQCGEEYTEKLFEQLRQNKWSLMDMSEQVLAPLFGCKTLT